MTPGENLKTPDLHFGRFSVGERALFDGEPVRLRAKAREVLAYLVLHENRVVTFEDLLDSLWPGLSVTPHSVTVIIRTLRVLLAGDESKSYAIESVYGRGYRFVLRKSRSGRGRTTASEPIAVSARTSECVARAAELRRLERCRDLVRDGIARVALLGGEPGMGKSSLVREFSRRTTEATDALVLVGSCRESVTAPEPFQPLFEIFEGLEKHLGNSELGQHMRRVAPTWLVQFPWLATAEELVELRRSLAGTHSGQVIRELRKLIADIATNRTVVIILEDLHRAEAATIDFVRSVAMRPIRSRVFLLATYRPVNAAVGRSEILGLREPSEHVVHVDLGPWDQAGIESYLRTRFGTEFSRSFLVDLARRSHGIPLLVTAMLDAMVRDGVLEKRGDHWTVDESADARHAALPEEVRGLALQQLGRLPKADRTLLEVAAVFGQDFFASDVADVAGLDAEDCADRLAELCEHKFFIAHNDPLATVGDHSFLHAAYRQAILESLPALRSRRLHRQAAEKIVRYPGDRRRADDLAAKFSAGHAWNRAADQWERAAARAVHLYAHAEAAGFVRRAIEAIEHERPSRKRDARLAQRHLDLANLNIVASGYADGSVLESFTRARQLAEGSAAEQVAFRACAGETIVHILNGRLEEAAAHAAVLEAAGSARPEWRSMASLYVAYVEGFSGRFERARQLCDHGLRWISRAEPGVPALRDLGISLAVQRMSFRVQTHDDESWLRNAEEILGCLPSKTVEEVHTFYTLGRAAVLAGRNDLAHGWAVRCMEIADRLSDRGYAVRARVFAAYASGGPAHEAAKVIAEALMSPGDLDSRFDVDLLWLLLAELQIRSGELDGARESLEEACRVGVPGTRSILWRLAGDLGAAARHASFDLRKGARSGGMIASCPDAMACYARAAETARTQQAQRLIRLAEEAAQRLSENGRPGIVL